jgi:hypothetical protein
MIDVLSDTSRVILQGRVGDRAWLDRHVEAGRDQVDRVVGDVEVELDLWIEREELRQQRRQRSHAEGRRTGQSDRPAWMAASSRISASIAAPSSRMRAARARAARPLSVNDSLRVVRVSSVVRRRASRRVTARETVALVRPSSRAASENEPHSATLEKIAQASKSG